MRSTVIVLFAAVFFWATDAASVFFTGIDLIKRQNPSALASSVVPPTLPPPITLPDPVQAVTPAEVDTPAVPNTALVSSLSTGDAFSCGKKVQSEKPSDPANEFLRCFIPGGISK